jgi:hypothetical protein
MVLDEIKRRKSQDLRKHAAHIALFFHSYFLGIEGFLDLIAFK